MPEMYSIIEEGDQMLAFWVLKLLVHIAKGHIPFHTFAVILFY